ncbi:MAG: lysophospholipid acyltransferase family protein [Rubripirellula sp.]
MTNVVLDRPYEFIPPHRGNFWPSFIQTFRIVDKYLKRKEGVVGYECRGLEHFKASVDRGDGILLAPNHCRYADPLVLGWPAREISVHLYAMASWHLFNKGRFDSFAITKMGGFSVNREGLDRQSLETAINAIAGAERPLVLFPEGTTNRTNDVLKPLLDGVAFIARSAARKRAKAGGQVVMHPIALKYLCVGDVHEWAHSQLQKIEDRLGWRLSIDKSSKGILDRTVRLAEGLLCLKEIEYFGESKSGDLPSRRDRLIQHTLASTESRLGIETTEENVRSRVRTIRTAVVTQFFQTQDASEHFRLRADVVAAELAQELLSYPDCYLLADQVTDTRIVETIQRMQENLWGKADVSIPLRVVVQFDEPVVVPPEKAPRGQTDPLMSGLETALNRMLASLSEEANPLLDA